MKEIAKLMNYRESVRVLDVTMRDGGLVNDFYFSDEFVKALYLANIKAGVDYMEFGYKADRDMFDESKYGPAKFSKDEYIRSIVGDNDTDLKIAVMADVGRTNFKRDIPNRAESPVDMYRVATYIHQMPAAVEMIQNIHDKGYETCCNIMAISTAREGDLRAALEIVAQTDVDVIYIVDSYGSMYPEEMARLVESYKEVADKYGKTLGIHAHNNLQMAFANTAEAVGDGVDILDASYAGMGRGAGNCPMELLLSFLKNPKYNVYPVICFIEDHIEKLRSQGAVWGYDLQYLMTGVLNQHPRNAIQFTKEGRKDYAEFYKELVVQD